jgi:hypothetical protein
MSSMASMTTPATTTNDDMPTITPPSVELVTPTHPHGTQLATPTAPPTSMLTNSSTAPATKLATPTTELATPIIPPAPPSTPMDPPTDSLISDLIFDTSDTAVSSLASQLGLNASLLDLSDFMTFIQPSPGDATPLSEATPSIAQLSGVDSSVSAPFGSSPLTSSHDPQPFPSTEISSPQAQGAKISHPQDPPPLMKAPPPPLTPVADVALSVAPGSRPDSLTLPPPPHATTPVVASTPPVVPLAGESGYLDLTDLLGSTDDDLLQGMPEDMAKSIQSLMQLDQQTWN